MIYRERGWLAPIPVDLGGTSKVIADFSGRKNLHNWPPSDNQITQWTRSHGHENVGLWLADDVIGIDVDAYGGKRGAEVMEQLEGSIIGVALPPTYTSTSRGPGQPSRIMFYRVARGIAWSSKLEIKVPGGETIGGVDIVQAAHRFARVWPSIKKDREPLGAVYQWYDLAGGVMNDVPNIDDLPYLPDEWVEHIRDRKRLRGHAIRNDAGVVTMTETEVAAWADSLPSQDELGICLQMKQTLKLWTEKIQSATSRHDDMVKGVRALMGDGVQGHRGALEAIDAFHDEFLAVVTDRTHEEAIGEWNRALDSLVPKLAHEPIRPPCSCGLTLKWMRTIMRPIQSKPADPDSSEAPAVDVEVTVSLDKVPHVGDLDYDKWYGTHTDHVVDRMMDVFGEHFRAIHQRKGPPVWLRNIGDIWIEDKKQGQHNAIKHVGRLIQTELDVWEERCTRLASDNVDDWRTRRVGGRGQNAEEFRIIVELRKLVGAMQDNEKKDQVEKAWSKRTEIAITAEELDANPRWLNLKNGHVLDVEAVHNNRPRVEWIVPRRSDMLLTKQLGCAHVAELDNVPGTMYEFSTFKRYIEGVLPDEDVRNTIQEIAGYSLLGNPTEKIIVLLHGMSDSGKTVLLEILEAMFGTYAVWADASALIANKARSTHQGWLHDLKGARLILTPETAKNAKLDAAWMKSYTGREPQKTRPPYGDQLVTWPPIGIIFNASNHYLKYDATDTAVSERTQVIEFEKRFLRGSEERDETLPATIKNRELPIVLNWCLEGLRRRGANGHVTIAPQVKEWSRIYQVQQSDTQQFIEDQLESGWLVKAEPGTAVSRMAKLDVVYRLYELWCEDQKIKPAGTRDFNSTLVEVHKWDKKNSGGWRWIGYTSPFATKVSVSSRDTRDLEGHDMPYNS